MTMDDGRLIVVFTKNGIHEHAFFDLSSTDIENRVFREVTGLGGDPIVFDDLELK